MGALANASTPELLLMVNLPWSVPPVSEKVTVSLLASVATTVVTAVLFSATLIAAVAPPPLEVMTGAVLGVAAVML